MDNLCRFRDDFFLGGGWTSEPDLILIKSFLPPLAGEIQFSIRNKCGLAN